MFANYQETNGSMASLPSDSRQPPDGHEFPDFIEIHSESTRKYYTEKEIHVNTYNVDFSKPSESLNLDEFPKESSLLSCQVVSTSNTDLRPKKYESTEDLKCNNYAPETNLLHTRSQSLIDVSALAKQKNTKWNQMFEQRRKGLSKLKGLVIPEAIETEVSSKVNIPEIKSQNAPAVYLPVPKLDNSFQSEENLSLDSTDLLRSSVVFPSWLSNSSSTLPKYSPAFKRKSLQIYPTSINKSENSEYVTNTEFSKYCDKASPKANRMNDDDLNPPKSLESISSPTRSDCSFDYISSTRKMNKSSNESFQKLGGGKLEDESDNDSAVSSSQSSYNSRYSPPSSPTRSCELDHYSKKLEEDDITSQNRLLKPSSVEAINRKNILASAKCRSGKDLKIGSPVIRRKQEEAQTRRSVHEIRQNGRGKYEESVIEEPIPIRKPLKIPPIDPAVSVGHRDEEPMDITKITEIKPTMKPYKEIVETENKIPLSEMPSKDVFIPPSPTPAITTTKKSIELTDKTHNSFISTFKTRKPAPINVKALKQNFESLTSPPPMPRKVPVFKTTVSRRNSKVEDAINVVTPVSNGVGREQKVEKTEAPKAQVENRNSSNKSSDNEIKTVVLKTDSKGTSLGITLSGGVDENKDITIHRIRYASVAFNEGSLKKGNKIISVNGKNTAGLTHLEAIELLKEPVSEFTIVIETGSDVVPSPANSRSSSLSRRSTSLSVISDTKSQSAEIVEKKKANNVISMIKDGAGLGFSIEGGKDSPLGDVPLLVKKIFTGGAADKSSKLEVGDQIIQVNDIKFVELTRIEAWNIMKKIPDGKVNIHVYRL